MPNDEPLGDLARAVLDGAPVDWATAESGAPADDRRLIRQLRLIEGLAAVHRQDPEAPDHWGHLRIIEAIGRGASGVVYHAWDSRLDRDVALKLLPAPPPAARPTTIIDEGRLLARVRHANVVTIYGADQIGGQIGLWMELVHGQTLEQLLQRRGVFDAAEAIEIGIQLCRAVSAVHGAGLLHRDIKANNVTRADDGRIVLMDLGAGRDLDDNSASDLTGTPLYLAPEVLRGDKATRGSDIYSLGVLLCRLLTREYPVRGRTIGDVRRAHERGDRVRLRAARPDLPASLADVVERAADPTPGRRFISADALGAALLALEHGPSARRRRPVTAVVAAMLLALTAGLTWASRGPAAVTDRPAASALPSRPAIAVLPLQNETRGDGTDEFVDGLTSELQRNLAAIDGLELRSSMSAFAFKSRPRNLADIRSRLGVDLVLDGSVFSAGDSLRVTARLIRVADGVILWADVFDRRRRDVFAIQTDIASAIVNRLRLKLGRGPRRFQTAPDLSYQFVRAQGLQTRRSPENASKAVDLFDQIVAKDPSFVPAWAGLASALAGLSRLTSPTPDLPPLDPRMEAAALNAIRLDPLSAEAQAAMGSLYSRDRRLALAETSFRKSLDLNPTLTTTYTDYVLSTLMPLGRFDDAVRVLEAAMRADPESLDVRRVLAHVQVNMGRYDDAIATCRWVMARDPDFPYIDLWMGRALTLAGRPDDAFRVFERKGGQWPYLGYLMAVTGRRAEAEALVTRHPDDPLRQMLVYGGLGDKDRAFAALERGAASNWWRAATWMLRPEMSVLRGDPRFAAMRRKLGLPD